MINFEEPGMNEVQEILKQHVNAHRDHLIPILQEVQEKCGFLNQNSIIQIAEHLNIPASKVYGVATFYNQFRFHPQGKYNIQVCRGTACHVKGSAVVLDALKKELGVMPNETTSDGIFSYEVVACIGACGLAPVIAIDGQFHAKVNSDSIKDLLSEYRKKGDAK